MRVFMTRAFSRLGVARKLRNADLIAAVTEMNDGLLGVNLGGQVYKKRVALSGAGKRSGARTLVAFKGNERAIFVYGFNKNQRDNVTDKEKKALKLLASRLLGYNEQSLAKALKLGELFEIKV
jgi:hypothetical protein